MGSAPPLSDHGGSQQRTVKEPNMVSRDLHTVTVRLDVLRDIMIELAAALPPDRAAGVWLATIRLSGGQDS